MRRNAVAPLLPPDVAEAFERFDGPALTALLAVRATVFAVAAEQPATGGVREYLSWGQPAYRPSLDGVGTAVRLGEHRPGRPAMFVHCRTTLIREFRSLTDEVEFEGQRAVLLEPENPLPNAALRGMIGLAFRYFARRDAEATEVEIRETHDG